MSNFHLKFGLVSDVKAGYVKVYFEEDNYVTKWLPVLVRYAMKDKESWFPSINEQVACLLDEYLDEGVILGAIHSDPDPPDSGAADGKFRQVFEDGTFLEYDKNAHTLTANVQGDATVQANNVTANAQNTATVQTNNITAKAAVQATLEAPTITLQGNVTVAGDLSAGSLTLSPSGSSDGMVHGDLKVKGDVQSGTISLKTHIHGGVQTGAGSTTPPTV